MTIAAEISHALNDANEIDDADIKDFNSKTASVLISLAAVMPLIAAKAGLHLVGLGGAGEALQEVYKEGKDVYDTASEEIANKVKEHIEKKIENHHIEKQTIQDFKQELAELAAKLEKPLVFIIDELDRCRPDFAIRSIERIKHFFDIPKIVFVLVMDKTQFSKVVCHNYGYDESLGEEYLTKFIDFTVEFPNLGKTQLYEEVIAQQLYRIGELTSVDTKNELFFWILSLQSSKEYNSRELVKKINQYALLRTNDFKLNLILNAFIFDENFNISANYLHKIIDYLFNYLNGDENGYTTKSYFIRQQLLNEKNIDDIIICNLYETLLDIEERFKTVGQKDHKNQTLQRFLSPYCISKLKDIKDFNSIWMQNIKTGLFEKY